ncbi:putative acid--amine ligase YgiC [Colletotrichum sp. SAR 10_70]|nr:putative acid--amine ligase YgiC [Colletotrichum sp. SAR 10_71]KAI8153982.1 putative acid--amine ligase YgiC [Colletotrichum sp. SAR 10_70]
MWTNTMARRVIRDRGRITGVEIESRGDGGRCGIVNVTESTGRVVISGGYYGTPKLLFRSGIGPEDQLRIVQQSTDGPDFIEEPQWIKLPVGRNLHDHTVTDLQITHKDVNYYDFQIGAWESPIQADVDAYLKNRTGMLTMTAPNDGPIMWEVVDGPDGPRQFQYTARVAGATKNSMTISQFLGRGGTSVGAVTINPNLTMSISTLPYQQTKEDKAAIIASIKNLMKALSTDPDIVFTHPPANMTVEQYIEEMPVNLQRRRGLHYLGTAKMGIDSGLEGGTSVVDTHTRVYAAANQIRIRALDIPGDHRRSASLIVNDAVTDLKVSAIMLDEDEFLCCLGSSSIAIGKGHNLAMLVDAVRPSIGSSRKEGGDCELLEARKGEGVCDLVAPGASEPYWPDNRYYSFTEEEIHLLEGAAKDVFAMCCEAADYLTENQDIITKDMAVPAFTLSEIKKSWNREPAWGSIYGRFDVCFGGLNHPDPRLRQPKFYEFNADTPTSLLEAGSIQWLWLEQTGNGSDQYNSITEKLITAWQRNLTHIQQMLGHKPVVHFAAGWQTKALTVEEISISKNDGRFYDANGDHLDVIFKLYPWEFMVQEAFAQSCFQDMGKIGLHDEAGNYVGGTIWIEPPYKMLWSNKSIFAILWRLFKDDPRGKWLLPTYVNEAPSSMTSFARKPIFAREGADVVLQRDGRVIQDASTGGYGAEGYVVQELALLPEFRAADGNTYYPVIGLWFIDGDPAGMGIREDRTPITTNTSVFIPHSIEGGPATYEKQRIPDNEEIEEQMRVAPFFDSFDWEENEIVSFMKKIVLG